MTFRTLSRHLLTFMTLLAMAGAALAEAPEWRPLVFMDNELYPSYLVAVANLKPADTRSSYILGDGNGIIGCYVKSPRKNSKVRFTLEIDELAKSQTFDYILPEKDQIYMLLPTVVWNWRAVRASRQPHAANCKFTLAVNGSGSETHNQVVTVRSINEALLGFQTDFPGREESWVPTNFVLHPTSMRTTLGSTNFCARRWTQGSSILSTDTRVETPIRCSARYGRSGTPCKDADSVTLVSPRPRLATKRLSTSTCAFSRMPSPPPRPTASTAP